MLIRRAAALVLPPRCPGCSAIVEADHRFCAACWSGLRMIAPPWCARCNLPFALDRGEQAQCAACIAQPPCHDGIRAAVHYGEVARTVALRLKYGGRTANAVTMARAMARLMPDGIDLIVPVPLHRWRLWGRGFNQAQLIASALGHITALPVDPLLLRRTRATPLLRGLGARARRKAVRGAFALAGGEVQGRAVALIDDIYTSGATTDACVALLKRAGASRVTIMCWARVLEHDGVAD